MGVNEKKIASDCFSFILTLPPDTHPWIKKNRDKFLPHYLELNKLKLNGYKHDALDYAYEWFHFFDEGHKSPYKIDDLRGLMINSLADMGLDG